MAEEIKKPDRIYSPSKKVFFKKDTRPRFVEIDALRTLAIVLMIAFHTAYDLSAYYRWTIDVTEGVWWWIGRSAAVLFLLLVGVSFFLSTRGLTNLNMMRKMMKRALNIGAGAMIITAITYWYDPTTYVRFGILHLIAVSALLLPFLRHGKEWNAVLGTLCIIVGLLIQDISLGTPLLIPFGITPPLFQTVDYYPLFPWLGVILIGLFLGMIVYQDREPNVSHPAMRMLTLPGKHALLLYLFHQPIILIILWAIFEL